jgi:hypothetical protein
MSDINQIGFIFVLIMGSLMLFFPRRLAVLPMLCATCLMTLGQGITIGPLHFTIFRIVIFFGLIRVVFRREIFSIRLHSIDKILFLYTITSVTAYIILRKGSSEAITNQLGFIYNSLFLYAVLRSLILDWEDINLIFKMIALIFILLALAMMLEKATGRNLFSVFGGVREFTMTREGRLRCQGPFAHPILAGTVGATSLPLMISIWFQNARKKWIGGMGIIAATIITVTSASSGPAVTYMVVLIGIAAWRLRDYMREVRWLILLSVIGLHIVMKAPVWALIGRLSEVIGGTGWHRVMLIDAAIRHFDEWWLLGTDYTRHWMPTGVSWSEKHTDITNQFISVGIDGGLISLIFFILIILFCFRNIGIKLKEAHPESSEKFTLWCMGVTLLGHLVSFTSVHYFDQIIIMWYLLIALITTVSINPSKN